MQRDCQVCLKQKSKYKCPKCLIKYCAVPCFKIHKCKQRPLSSQQSQQQSTEEGIFKSDYVDEDVKLPMHKLEMLKNSKKIRTYLTSQKLRTKLKKIDDSKQRMNELNHEIKHDKDFEKFVYDLLQEMGVE